MKKKLSHKLFFAKTLTLPFLAKLMMAGKTFGLK